MIGESFSTPKPYWLKRLHTLTGIWLVLFLIQHLITNSEAALFFGDDGAGFIRAVNRIHEIPYLIVIELVLLALPFLIHGVWGIVYARRGQMNHFSSDGSLPSLGMYRENQAYSWQRITSWVLLVGILLHVLHMRILEYPVRVEMGTEHWYLVRVTDDPALAPLANRLGVQLFSQETIEKYASNPWKEVLQKWKLSKNETIAIADNFGTIDLLVVRNAFKSPLLVGLYSIFVLSAAFHAFNGLWTASISLGIMTTRRGQQFFRIFSYGLMLVIAFLGLIAVWGAYWINLKT